MPLRCFILVMSLFISACSFMEEKRIEIHQQKKQVFTVPKDIKVLLTREMRAIEKGMQVLLRSIVTADWQTTAETAKQIQSSYLLKQGLTAEQKTDLHHRLPEQFIALDHSFHQFAGMLAHAAKVKNSDVVNFYFYKMTESCVQCHSRYAKQKFSGFSVETHEVHH